MRELKVSIVLSLLLIALAFVIYFHTDDKNPQDHGKEQSAVERMDEALKKNDIRIMRDLWDQWAKREIEHFEFTERQMEYTYTLLGNFLNEYVKDRTINFIDVGCATGDYLLRIKDKMKKNLFSIGIDPIDWEERAAYSVYLQLAITNKPEGKYNFNLYGWKDLSSSSLEEINKGHVTHNQEEEKEKFYHPVKIETEKGVITVNAVHLSSIIESHKLQDQTVHFLKIDIQGTDIQALLSMGKYIDNILFIQYETIYEGDKKFTLYKNQTIFNEERPVLEKLGFRLLNVAKFPHGPEADVLFVKEKLFNTLFK